MGDFAAKLCFQQSHLLHIWHQQMLQKPHTIPQNLQQSALSVCFHCFTYFPWDEIPSLSLSDPYTSSSSYIFPSLPFCPPCPSILLQPLLSSIKNMASGSGNSGSWTFEQIKIVETAFLDYPEDDPDRWEKIAGRVGGGKTAEDVKKYHSDLIDDLVNIMAGRVELPVYKDDSGEISDVEDTAESVGDDTKAQETTGTDVESD